MVGYHRQINKVINVGRKVAQKFGISDVFIEDKNLAHIIGEPIWISISEPNMPLTIVQNYYLDHRPNLKLSFWDVGEDFSMNGQSYPPASENDAKMIVDFILQHPGKDILVNCAAGVSRSSAICKFCEEILGYEWVKERKVHARPNIHLLELMIKYYKTLEPITTTNATEVIWVKPQDDL